MKYDEAKRHWINLSQSTKTLELMIESLGRVLEHAARSPVFGGHDGPFKPASLDAMADAVRLQVEQVHRAAQRTTDAIADMEETPNA